MEPIKNYIPGEEKTEEFVVNIGPQHPSTHGVLRFQTTLDGETIKDLVPVIGYIHRGIEKMTESLGYKQSIYLTSRFDYLSAHMNNQVCCLAIEKALQVEVPERAQMLRILMCELQRLASHELWWGSCSMDVGAVTPFFLAFRDRERTAVEEVLIGSRVSTTPVHARGIRRQARGWWGDDHRLERRARAPHAPGTRPGRTDLFVCGLQEVRRGNQPSLEKEILGDRLELSPSYLDRSTRRFSTNGATATGPDSSPEPLLHRPTRNPNTV